MKTNSQALREQEAQKREAVKAILDKPDAEITDEEMKSVETMQGEIKDLAAKAQKAESLEAFKTENDSELDKINKTPATKAVHPSVPARVNKNWPGGAFVKSFKSDETANGKSAAEKAGRFGYFIAACANRPWARAKCAELGIPLMSGVAEYDATKAHTETINTAGGYLVPEEFDNDIIVLREQYGVFRANMRVTPMARDTKVIPKRTGGLTGYYISENTTITESSKTWARVQLVAKKLGVLAKYSSELDEDAVVNIGDDLAGEIAYAFANQEDLAGFNGDGTSTYGGIVGFTNAINNVSSNAGIQAGSGSGWTGLVLADFNKLKGLLPQYAIVRGNVKWYVSQSFWGSVMERLALAAGGNTSLNILQGAPNYSFLGFPVQIAQALPVSSASSQLCAFLGDINLAAVMGDRRNTSIAMSEHLNFAEDEIAIRGTERFDIVVHAPGTSSVAGPVVALKTS